MPCGQPVDISAAVVVRRARPGEALRIQHVERSANAIFRTIDMDAVADLPPTAEGLLAAAIDDGRVVVAQVRDEVIGFALVTTHPPDLHLEQVSVEPTHGGHGIGRTLICAVGRLATEFDCKAITLTTFADVPWNAPMYRRLGFHEIPATELGDRLRKTMRHNAEGPLAEWPRVAMRGPAAAGDTTTEEANSG